MKVIGIDPGIIATGYGILENGRCVCTGTIRPKTRGIYSKVFEICENIKQLIKKNKPDIASLEKVFHRKNIKSLIRSSELRGAIILILLENGIKITEYTPAQIKLTTTGNGRASKEQVRYFVERVIMENHERTSSHATDAIAIAYTAIRKMRNTLEIHYD